MVFLFTWALGLVVAALHVSSGVRDSTGDRSSRPFGVSVCLWFGFGRVGWVHGHALNPVETARGIGWPPAPQFQFELAAFEIGFALAAFLCVFIRNKYYWLGVAIAPAVFFLLAAVQHVCDAGDWQPGTVQRVDCFA